MDNPSFFVRFLFRFCLYEGKNNKYMEFLSKLCYTKYIYIVR